MRIAVSQHRPIAGPVEAGLSNLERVAGLARDAGAELLITPEMGLTGYNIGAAAVKRWAEPRDGRYAEAVSLISQKYGLAIVYGYPERDSRDAVYNSAQLIDASGAVLLNYRKTHLYGAIDSSQFHAGEALSDIVDLNGWRVALAICYDIEFPELVRALALAGADFVIAPTANMTPFESVCARLAPARAEENAVYLAYANYTGAEGETAYCGASCICGPDGEDLARAGAGEEMMFADLTPGSLERVRAAATHMADRRPDLYASLIQEASEKHG